jgi:hypothetical protein
MSDDRMIRIDNLKLVKRLQGLDNVRLGELYGCSDTYIGKILGHKSAFGEKAARKMEEALGLPTKWLDEVHDDADYEDEADRLAQQRKREGRAVVTGDGIAARSLQTEERPAFTGVADIGPSLRLAVERVKTFPMAPVIEWARLGEDLSRANNEWPASELREVPTTRNVSDRVKWIPVIDDALAPALGIGDLIAIDPHGQPKQDEVTLFRTAAGEYVIRRWRALPNGQFEAASANGQALDSIRHGISVAGSFVGVFRTKV